MIKFLFKYVCVLSSCLFLVHPVQASLFGPSEKEKRMQELAEQYEPCQDASYMQNNQQRCEAIANELRELSGDEGGEQAANVKEFEEKCSGENWANNVQRCQELAKTFEESQQNGTTGSTSNSGNTGSSGVSGNYGSSGNTGSSGTSGNSGTSGSSSNTGSTGDSDGGSAASGSDSTTVNTGGTSVVTGSDGTTVNAGGTSVSTGTDGTAVNTGDTSVTTGENGTSVNTGGTSVETGVGGTSVNTGNTSVTAGSGVHNVRVWYSGIDGLGNLLADSDSNPELKHLMDSKWGQAARYYVSNGKNRMPAELVMDLATIGIRVDLSMREQQLIESQGNNLFGQRGEGATVQGAGSSGNTDGQGGDNSSAAASPCADYWYRSYHPEECADYQSGSAGNSAGGSQQTTGSQASQNGGSSSQSGSDSQATEGAAAQGGASAPQTSFIGPDSSSAYSYGGQATGIGGAKALGGNSSTGAASAPGYFAPSTSGSLPGSTRTFYSYEELLAVMEEGEQSGEDDDSGETPVDDEDDDSVEPPVDDEDDDSEEPPVDDEEDDSEEPPVDDEEDEDDDDGGVVGTPVTMGLSVGGVYFRQYGSEVSTINFTKQIGNEISVSDFTSSNPFLGGIYASANTDFTFRAISTGILSMNSSAPAPTVIFADNTMLTDSFSGYPSSFDVDSAAVILGQSYFEGKTQQLALSAIIHEFVHSQQDAGQVSALSSYYGPDGRFATNELLTDPAGAFLEGTAMFYQAYYYPERWNQHQFGLARCGFIKEDSGSSVESPQYNGGIASSDLSCENALSYKNMGLSDFDLSPSVLTNILLEFAYRAPKVASGAMLGEGIVNQAITEAFNEGLSSPQELLSKIGGILSSDEPMFDKFGNELTADEVKALRLSFAIILDVMTNFSYSDDMDTFKAITGTTDDDLSSYLTAYPTDSALMVEMLSSLEDSEPEVHEKISSRTSASHRDLLKAIANKSARNGTQVRFNGFEALDGLPALNEGDFAALSLPRLDGTGAIARGLNLAGIDYENTEVLGPISQEPTSYSADGAFINKPF